MTGREMKQQRFDRATARRGVESSHLFDILLIVAIAAITASVVIPTLRVLFQ